MCNPIETIPDDILNDIQLRCGMLKIVSIDENCFLKYKIGSEIIAEDCIPHITLNVKTNPFEDENQFFEYMELTMNDSMYWRPWEQKWYINQTQ